MKVFFGFIILLLVFSTVIPATGRAQTKTITSPTLTPALEKQDTQKQSEATASSQPTADQYPLPYPGILPDNPLYFLKALRDRIMLFLISDPVKKAEFNLITSDKRIYAAELLSKNDKDALSITTLSKSNNYFDNAIQSVMEAKKMGKRVDIVLDSMKKSIVKHREVLSLIAKNVSGDFSNQLQIEEERMITFGKSVDDLLLK